MEIWDRQTGGATKESTRYDFLCSLLSHLLMPLIRRISNALDFAQILLFTTINSRPASVFAAMTHLFHPICHLLLHLPVLVKRRPESALGLRMTTRKVLKLTNPWMIPRVSSAQRARESRRPSPRNLARSAQRLPMPTRCSSLSLYPTTMIWMLMRQHRLHRNVARRDLT